MEYVKSLDNGHRESDLPALSNRRHVAQALIGQRHFIYSRIGHSQREMELLSDGRIGRGSDTCEQEWTVEERGGRTVLTFSGNEGVICELQQDESGIWRGEWLKFEKTPIAFFPRQLPANLEQENQPSEFQVDGLNLERVSGIPLYCRPHTWDRWVANEVISDDCYRLTSIVGQLNPLTIVDVGAHIGSFACWAKALWPSARVVAFEPVPANFLLLARNTAFLPNVTCRMFALHDRRGIARIREGENTGGGRVGSEGTSILTLDTITALNLEHIKTIDILKLDCEGGEGLILDSLRESGHLQATKYVVGEWHDDHLADIERLKDEFDIVTRNQGDLGYFWATRKECVDRV